ncbi:MAG: mechanosensitive ion channel family protein [Thermoanaerobaculia bacterium]
MKLDRGILAPVSRWDDKVDTFVRAFAVKLADFLPRLIAAVLVLFAFWMLHRAARGILNRSFKARTNLLAADILRKVVKYGLLGLGLLMAASQLGLDIMSMLAGLGVAGLAVGLAAKDTLANFISGLIILWDRPFELGDDVVIGDTPGFVRHIELRSTRLETYDGNDVILPNSDVVNRRITNFSRTPKLRIRISVGVAYATDLQKARAAMLGAAKGDGRLLERPGPAVVVSELADSAVNLELLVWIRDPTSRVSVRAEYLERVKSALDAAGVQIPFPQREVHLLESAGA